MLIGDRGGSGKSGKSCVSPSHRSFGGIFLIRWMGAVIWSRWVPVSTSSDCLTEIFLAEIFLAEIF
jgi:hypothetical protein